MRRKRDNDLDIAELFETGVALDSAWIEFSPDMDRFALRALMTTPAQDDILQEEDPKRYEQLSKGWLPTTWESRKKKLELRTRDQRGYLLDGIYRGDLIAIGFHTLQDGSDELVRVPRQHFFVDYKGVDPFPEINWSKGELRVGDSSFFDIHVVEGSHDEQFHFDTVEAKTDKAQSIASSKRGRPKTEDQIEEAVEELINAGPEFLALPNRTAQAAEVRAKICGKGAKDDHQRIGFSTSTIVKIIGRVVRASQVADKSDRTD